jgi:undecaprenyl-diphosphatase
VTHRVEALDPLFVAVTTIGSLGLVWIVLAALLAIRWRRLPVFLHVTAGVFLADLLALAVKVVTDRARPYVAEPEPAPLVDAALDLSFPSGHAATAFAGATLLASRVPRLAVPLYLLAAAVAWSRVYVGVHYPTDVLVGALLGTAVGAALVYLETATARPRSGGRSPSRSTGAPDGRTGKARTSSIGGASAASADGLRKAGGVTGKARDSSKRQRKRSRGP